MRHKKVASLSIHGTENRNPNTEGCYLSSHDVLYFRKTKSHTNCNLKLFSRVVFTEKAFPIFYLNLMM
jgi:hypothetical protein